MRYLCRMLPFAIFAVLSQLGVAQTSDWSTVKLLLPGQHVKIVKVDGHSTAGFLQSVTDDGIQLGKSQFIQKQNVWQVMLRTGSHRGRNALIGAGVGAATGVGVGAASGCSKGESFCIVSKPTAIAVLAPLLGGAGAGIGALLPSHGWQMIYRSR